MTTLWFGVGSAIGIFMPLTSRVNPLISNRTISRVGSVTSALLKSSAHLFRRYFNTQPAGAFLAALSVELKFHRVFAAC